MLGTLILLLLSGAAIALWVEALGAHESARAACRRLCQEAKLQLIDETVALQRLRVVRGTHGIVLQRRYAFDVSFDGTDRHPGSITLLGRRRQSHTLPMPAGVDHLIEASAPPT